MSGRNTRATPLEQMVVLLPLIRAFADVVYVDEGGPLDPRARRLGRAAAEALVADTYETLAKARATWAVQLIEETERKLRASIEEARRAPLLEMPRLLPGAADVLEGWVWKPRIPDAVCACRGTVLVAGVERSCPSIAAPVAWPDAGGSCWLACPGAPLEARSSCGWVRRARLLGWETREFERRGGHVV